MDLKNDTQLPDYQVFISTVGLPILRAAQTHWDAKTYAQAVVFGIYFRKENKKISKEIIDGVQIKITYLQNLSFSPDTIQYLGALRNADKSAVFSESFLNYLQRLSLQNATKIGLANAPTTAAMPLVRVAGQQLPTQLLATALCAWLNMDSVEPLYEVEKIG